MYIRKILLFSFFFLNLCFGQEKNVGLGQSGGGGGINGITSDGTTITITLPVVITPTSGTGLVLTRATNDTLKLMDSGGNFITVEDNNTLKFEINSAGGVGIGGVASTNAEELLKISSGGNNILVIQGATARLKLIPIVGSQEPFRITADGGLFMFTSDDATPTNFMIAEADAPNNSFYIDSAGDIGLGISTPDSTLDVNGGSKFRDNINITQAGGTGTTDPTQVIINNSTSNGSAEIRISEDSGAGEDGVIVRYFSSADATDNELRFIKFTNGTEQNVFPLVIDRDGEVRIGTTTAPSAGGGLGTMIFADTGTAPTPGTNTAAIFGDDVAGTVHMFATQEGNGTGTQLSSHNTKGDPVHFSYNKKKDEAVYINLIKLAKAIEKISGEKLVYTSKIMDKDNPTATRLYLEKLAGDLDED